MPRSNEVYLGFGKQPNGYQFETSNASTPSGMLGASGIWLGLTPNLTLVVWKTPVPWLFPASDKGSLMCQGDCLGPGVFSGWGLPIQEESFQAEGEFRHRLLTERQEP